MTHGGAQEAGTESVAGPVWYPAHHFEKCRLALLEGLQQGQRVITLTGAPGVGKSYLLSQLHDWVPPHSGCLLVENPGQPNDTFIHEIAADLAVQQRYHNINSPLWQDGRALVAAIHVHLQAGFGLVLAIDQAHLLKGDNLRLVQHILAIEPVNGVMVQLVLSGRRHLHEQLQLPDYDFLGNEVEQRLRLGPFDSHDVEGYVAYLLKRLELDEHYQFTPAAFKVLARYGGDNPRKLNRLVNQIMIKARQWQVTRIDNRTIHEALAGEHENWRWKSIGGGLKGLRWVALPLLGFIAGQLLPLPLFEAWQGRDPTGQQNREAPLNQPVVPAERYPYATPTRPLLDVEKVAIPKMPDSKPAQLPLPQETDDLLPPLAQVKVVPPPRMAAQLDGEHGSPVGFVKPAPLAVQAASQGKRQGESPAKRAVAAQQKALPTLAGTATKEAHKGEVAAVPNPQPGKQAVPPIALLSYQVSNIGGGQEPINLAKAIGAPQGAVVPEFEQESGVAAQEKIPVTDGGFVLEASGGHTLDRPYVLQFGTVSKILYADVLADKVRQAGVEPFIHSSQRDGQTLYSVRLAFVSMDEAKAKMQSLDLSHGLTPILLVIK
ncbi:Sporulation domain protein [Magnetococcus marinus MC-1]|uniref:Sporulation domain protein n=1 Tax=Magnetococcus marinus (strain ATCC BAA-1437 / JCM 17883 / MC-1) TaxID=156889 RepID=A0L681_MAGMM|nr:ATP-binding protein [Magnetococcus marinus]ABK43474.1 Sporulation domain protein [Magnetococcus marinus MC-1]